MGRRDDHDGDDDEGDDGDDESSLVMEVVKPEDARYLPMRIQGYKMKSIGGLTGPVLPSCLSCM